MFITSGVRRIYIKQTLVHTLGAPETANPRRVHTISTDLNIIHNFYYIFHYKNIIIENNLFRIMLL